MRIGIVFDLFIFSIHYLDEIPSVNQVLPAQPMARLLPRGIASVRYLKSVILNGLDAKSKYWYLRR